MLKRGLKMQVFSHFEEVAFSKFYVILWVYLLKF